MLHDEREDFRAYCRLVTGAQLRGIIEKERRHPNDPYHVECREIAESVARDRGIDPN